MSEPTQQTALSSSIAQKPKPSSARAGSSAPVLRAKSRKKNELVEKIFTFVSGNGDTASQRSLVGIALLLACVTTVGAYIFSTYRNDVMFSSSLEGQLTPLQPRDQPNISSDAVTNWAKSAASEIFTLTFSDLMSKLATAEKYFTPEGWVRFIAAFRDQGAFSAIMSQRQFITTIPGGLAVISEEGEVGGVYKWVVQLNLVTTVYAGTESVQRQKLAMHIVRIPTRDSPAGYAFAIDNITR